MNLLFGAAGSDARPEPLAEVAARVTRLYAVEPHPLAADHAAPDETVGVGVETDGGGVLGQARDGGTGLAFLGVLPRSVPGWSGGTAADDPDALAAHLLARYGERGDAFLDGIPGKWVVVVHEHDARAVLLGASGADLPRWFVAHGDDGSLAFATQVAATAAVLGDRARLDRSLEDFVLGYEFYPDRRTPYVGVRALAPGRLLRWRSGEVVEREIAPWTPPAPPLEPGDDVTEDAAIDALYDVFMAALADQAGTADRQAVMLGGFDSALVAAGLTRLGKTVETFSFWFDRTRHNQPHTDTLAAHLGTAHNWVRITPDDVAEGLASYALVFNRPSNQPHYLTNTVATARAMRARGFVQGLTGDGCDAVFLGYPMVHRRARLFMRLEGLPDPFLRRVEALGGWAPAERRLGRSLRVARNVVQVARRPWPARGHVAARTFDALSLARLRIDGAPPPEEDVESILARLAQGLDDVDPVRLAYLGKAVPGLNRAKLEATMAATGVALDAPYLHPAVARLAASLPRQLLRPDDRASMSATGKYVLARMAIDKGLLPREVVEQPKASPIDSPVDWWYAGPLRDAVLARLEHLPFAWDPGFVDTLLAPKLADHVYRRFVDIGSHATQEIGLLASYAGYHEVVERLTAP